MKIVRYEDAQGNVGYGALHGQRVTQLTGDLWGGFTDTGREVSVAKTLAPLVPTDILCIGLNYRKHAQEGNQPEPEYPVVFMKNLGTQIAERRGGLRVRTGGGDR
jgi:2-keto-4-pentenoate hydratase/2-oxohepta-3-ene-1,7-dioic acid hydratase in catechol pathway